MAYRPDQYKKMMANRTPVPNNYDDLVRGMSYMPYDILGAPVDLANLALTPFGLGSQKPVGGSSWMIDQAVEHLPEGWAQPEQHTGEELVGRILAGLGSPVIGVGAVRTAQAIEKAAPEVAQATMKAMPKGQTVQGTHFSSTPLDKLRADKAGTNRNLTGAERGREGAVPGVHLYERGVAPEAGTGRYGHRKKVKRVLDMDSGAAQRIRKQVKVDIQQRLDADAAGRWAAGTPQEAEIASALEQMALAQGYNGIKSGSVIKSFKDLPVQQHTRIDVPNPNPQTLSMHSQRNPEGFSIDPVTGEVPQTGIIGARRGTEEIVSEVTPAGIANRLEQIPTRPGEYLGGWSSGGKTYLDNSNVMNRGAFPRLRGNLNYQRSLFDLDNMEDIPLGVRRVIDTTRPLMGYSGHPAFPAGIPGKGVGVLKENLVAADLLPEQAASYGGFNQFARGLEMKPYAGMINEDILRMLEGLQR